MNWTMTDTWVAVVGALCAISCALPGCFLVLRRMSMMGDAISHAVLPGLAIAFLITHSRASFSMFLGAAVAGVLTAVFTQWVSHFGKVDRGAAMGIVFTTLFAFGLLLIVRAADHVDLDPGCVLYGAIELTPLYTVNLSLPGGTIVTVPKAALVVGGSLLMNLLFVFLLFKELKLSSFDPALATTVGVNANLMHYLLTNRLVTMLVLSAVIAAVTAVLGHVSALTVPGWFGFKDTRTSGMMSATAGLLFVLVWIFKTIQNRRNRRATTEAD